MEPMPSTLQIDEEPEIRYVIGPMGNHIVIIFLKVEGNKATSNYNLLYSET